MEHVGVDLLARQPVVLSTNAKTAPAIQGARSERIGHSWYGKPRKGHLDYIGAKFNCILVTIWSNIIQSLW